MIVAIEASTPLRPLTAVRCGLRFLTRLARRSAGSPGSSRWYAIAWSVFGQCTVSVAVGCVIISQHLINKEVLSVSLSRRAAWLPETLSSSRDLKLNTLEKLNKLDVTYQSSGTP